MTEYIIRRLLIAIPILWGLTLATFAIANLLPGDFVDAMIPEEERVRSGITQADMEVLREYYGLNKPVWERYLIWLRELVLKGNLGTSMYTGNPVATEFLRRLGLTMQLTAAALFLGMILGTTTGVIQALHPRSLFDNVANFLTFVWVSVPGFVFGIMAIYFFAFKIPIFPLGGAGPAGREYGVLTRLHYMGLPLIMLTLGALPGYMRFARNSMLDVIHSDYVMVARSKGLLERIVTLRHALRNALMPLITITGLSIPGLIGGAAIAETMFVWPGMGRWLVSSTRNRDYPVIVAMNLITSTLVLTFNLITDIAYAWADPRIRYQ